MDEGNTLGLSGEPQEIHPWHQNDLRWSQEEGRPCRFDCISRGVHKMRWLQRARKLYETTEQGDFWTGLILTSENVADRM